MAKKDQPAATEAASEALDSGNVDQIRDIIFGSQMRDYEKRFARLEERVLNESENLRSETGNRLDALESYLKQEISELSDKLATERGEREDDTLHLTSELDKTAAAADKKRTQMHDKLSKGLSDQREALLEQSKTLRDEIQNTRNSLTASLDRATEELRSDKTDRKALASMFTEIAMRLNEEFELPGNSKKRS